MFTIKCINKLINIKKQPTIALILVFMLIKVFWGIYFALAILDDIKFF